MSTSTTLKRLSAQDLHSLLLSPKASSVAVIDVRDADHLGGHIRSSHHFPSSTLDVRLPELVRKMANMPTVVFHCALSQERGPRAALRYVRERQRRIEKGEISVGMDMGAEDWGSEREGEEGKENANGDYEGRVEGEKGRGMRDRGAGKRGKEQEVYVLDKGFVGWQGLYGTDERLTEAYAADVWVDY